MAENQGTSTAVGRLYATALLDRVLVAGGEAEQAVGADVQGLLALWQTAPEFRRLCCNPVIGPEQQKDALRRWFAGRVQPTTLSLLQVLADHGRLADLEAVARAFATLLEARRNIIHIAVTTAVPLTDTERQTLIERLRARLRQEPVLDETVDPEVLGGIAIRGRDRQMDATLACLLRQASDRLHSCSEHLVRRATAIEA